jgi:ribosomal protein L40E
MKTKTKLLSIAIAVLILASTLSILPHNVKAQGSASAWDPTDDLYYYQSGQHASSWPVIDIVYTEISQVNSTHIKLLTKANQAIPLTNQWQSFYWLLDTGAPAPAWWNPIDSNDLTVSYYVGVSWSASGPLWITVNRYDDTGVHTLFQQDASDHPEGYFSNDTCFIIIPLDLIGNPTSIRCVAGSSDGLASSSGRHDKAPNTGHITLDVLPPSPLAQSLFWSQWWFLAIIGLGAIVIVLAFTTVHYRKKTPVSKETNVTQSKTAQKASKICPRCGANLPADSKFCGKCGTSLE